MIKTILLCFMLLSSALFSNICFGQSADEVRQFVKVNTDNVLSTKAMDLDSREKALTDLFIKIVDNVWMARFAIGPEWRTLNDSQQKIYIDTYKNYLLKTYLPTFEKHSTSDYKIDGIDDLGDNLFLAHMSIFENKQQPIKLGYKIKCIDENCYIRDIIAEEVSMLISQRSDFSSTLSRGGFDALISLLAKKSTIK